MLEVGGVDVLTISQQDWSRLQDSLTFPLPVLAVRREERGRERERSQAGPNISLK